MCIRDSDYVGFEINEKYYTAANRRLEEEKAQMRLFDLLEEQEKAGYRNDFPQHGQNVCKDFQPLYLIQRCRCLLYTSRCV